MEDKSIEIYLTHYFWFRIAVNQWQPQLCVATGYEAELYIVPRIHWYPLIYLNLLMDSSSPQLLCPTFAFMSLRTFHLVICWPSWRVPVCLFLMGKLFLILIALFWTFPGSKLYIFYDGRIVQYLWYRCILTYTAGKWHFVLHSFSKNSKCFISFELILCRLTNPEIMLPSWTSMVHLASMTICVNLELPLQHIPYES